MPRLRKVNAMPSTERRDVARDRTYEGLGLKWTGKGKGGIGVAVIGGLTGLLAGEMELEVPDEELAELEDDVSVDEVEDEDAEDDEFESESESEFELASGAGAFGGRTGAETTRRGGAVYETFFSTTFCRFAGLSTGFDAETFLFFCSTSLGLDRNVLVELEAANPTLYFISSSTNRLSSSCRRTTRHLPLR